MSARGYMSGAIVGAVAGGALGYFYFTENGRGHREGFTRAFDQLLAELQEARVLWQRLQQVTEQYQRARTSPVSPHLVHMFDVKPTGVRP